MTLCTNSARKFSVHKFSKGFDPFPANFSPILFLRLAILFVLTPKSNQRPKTKRESGFKDSPSKKLEVFVGEIRLE